MENTDQAVFPKAFGWIGLGAMGFPMALQLRKHIPVESVLYIYDIDKEAMERYVTTAKEIGVAANVYMMNTAREVAENSVRFLRASLNYLVR